MGETKRTIDASAKRKAIMTSRAFREWWSARQHIHPIPSDPYRAFMIDIGLTAKVLPKELWRSRTPISDFPDIDYPKFAPAPKTRMLGRKALARMRKAGIPRAARPEPKTPFVIKLEEELGKLSEKYHLPSVRLRPEATMGSVGAGSYYGMREIIGATPFIRVGTRGVEKDKGVQAQVAASLLHEFGHHAFQHGIAPLAEATFQERGRGKIEWTPRRKEEKQAWAVGLPHLKDLTDIAGVRIGKFRGRMMLGTYLGTSPPFTYES